MASLNQVFYGILILQIYVKAAPSDVSKFGDNVQVEELVDTTSKSTAGSTGPTKSPRQKRYFNPFTYGFPPVNPLILPNFKRDTDFPVPTFGSEEPLLQIQNRVQEIANAVRSPIPPHNPHLPLNQLPIFYPVVFIPPYDCACNSANRNTNVSPPTGQLIPNVTTRFPVMDDERQNWGIVINNSDVNNRNQGDDQGGQDFARPISFDPIRLNRPIARPPPPVEHGTLQSEAPENTIPQSSSGNSRPENNPLPPPFAGSMDVAPSTFTTTFRPPTRMPQNEGPSRCDGAILTCCHQPQVVYDCFAIQGCPNFTSYGNPCNTKNILSVIEKFQKYYGKGSG